MRRTAHNIGRIGIAQLHHEHLQAANDAHCRAMERRAVAWTFVLCLVLALAILLPRALA